MSTTTTSNDDQVTPEMKQLIEGDLIRILSSGQPRIARNLDGTTVSYIPTTDPTGIEIPEGSVTEGLVSEPLVSAVVRMLNEFGFDDAAANTIIRGVGTAGPDRMQRLQW